MCELTPGNFYDYYLKKYSASTISKDGFIKRQDSRVKLATYQSHMKYTTYDQLTMITRPFFT